MPNEIYHRSNWGESKAEGFGDVYYDHAATNKLYNHSDYYENSDGTDATLKDLNNKASIVLTPTAYSDGSLNTVIPPYAPSYIENVPFVTSEWNTLQEGWSIDETNNKLVAAATWTGFNKSAQYSIDEIQVGKTVKFSFDAVVTAGEFHFAEPFSSGNVGYGSPNFINQSGSYSFTFLAAQKSVKFRNKSTDFAGEITNIRVEVIEEADFDFSRGSSATRVNEQGLVEDVQILSGELVQNGDFEQIGSELITNGNFDTDSDWTKVQATISNGEATITSPDGSYAAVYQDILTVGKIYKYRVEVKSVTNNIVIYAGVGTDVEITEQGTYEGYIKANNYRFELKRKGGTITSATIDNVSVKEVGQNWTFGTSWSMGDGVAISDGGGSYLTDSVSSGFTSGNKYRVSLEIVEYNSGSVSLPFDGAGGNTNYQNSVGVKTADITAQNNSPIYIYSSGFDGTIDNVSVIEITDDTDLPRIDFTDGTGSLLLEPQRTNSVPYSNDFSQQSIAGGSITSDDIVSPDGSINADTFVEDTNNSQHKIQKLISVTSGTYTMSCFVKGTDRFISLYPQGISTAYAVFDIANGNVTVSGGSDYVDSQIQSFENDWYRCSLTYNVGTGTSITHIYLSNSSTNPAPTYTGNGSEMSFYGLQLESGNYPTSYIPTSGSTVTRSADVANNSGNADLFNDSEGVLYAEIASLADDGTGRRMSISDGSNQNRIVLMYHSTSNVVRVFVYSNWSLVSDMTYTVSDTTQFSKIAFSYKQNDFKLWIDGVQRTTDDSGATPTGLKELAFDDGSGSANFYGKTKCVAVFKEALSNDLLERLTGEGYESFRLLAEANNYTII